MLTKIKIFIQKTLYNKELLLVGFSQVISLFASLIFIKLVSHYASVSEYGLYSLLLSVTAFVALFPFTAFDQAIGRYVSVYHDEKTYPENYTNIIYMYILLIGVLVLLFSFSYPFIKPYMQTDILQLFNILILFTILSIFRTTLLQIENYNRNRTIVLYSKIFEGLFRILLLIVIINYSFVTADKILLISCVILLINIFWILFYRKNFLTIKGLKFDLLVVNFNNYYKFASPLLIWAVFGWLQLYATTWFLQYYRSVEEVGYFTLINTIALIVPAQIVGIIGTFIVPIMYQKEGKHIGYTKVKSKQITIYLILLFSGIALVMFLVPDFIIGTLSSNKYTIYSWLLPYLFLAASFANLGQIWTYQFFVYKKTKQLLLAQILPSLISILSSYILVPKYGIVGVVGSLLISSFSFLLLVVLLYYKNFNQRKFVSYDSN